MSLTPFFSLTPNEPRAYTYDPANPDNPYASALVDSYGGWTYSYSPYRLPDQGANSELVLGYNPVAPGSGITSLVNDVFRKSALRLYFYTANHATDNQYLFLFQLNGISSGVTAQFFLGADLLREEAISGDEQIAVLMDATPNMSHYLYVRLAATYFSARMSFKGVDVYLL